jgi:hypothetical protein
VSILDIAILSVGVILFDIRKRTEWYSAPFLIVLYDFISLLFFQGVLWMDIGSSSLLRLSLAALESGADTAAIIYLLLGAVAWLSCIVPKTAQPAANSTSGGTIDYRKFFKCVPVILQLLTIGTFIHAVFLDWDKYWFSTLYLEQKNPAQMGLSFFPAALYQMLMPLVLIATGSLTLLLWGEKKMHLCVWSAAVFFYSWIFELAVHSRWAGASLILAAAVYFILGIRKRMLVTVSCSIMGLIAYTQALVGRLTGEHGLSTVLSTWQFFDMGLAFDYIWVLFYTVFQGIFTVALSATVVPWQYDVAYKVLSFSPLPSIIDGFKDLLETNEARVNYFIPMSSWIEALRFGYVYFGILLLTLYFLLHANARLCRRGKTPSVILISIISLALFIFMGSYEIRSVYRFILVLLGIQLWMLAPNKVAAKPVSTI